MIYIDEKRYACEKCIRGHRTKTCSHKDAPLVEIRNRGRPVSQCDTCREWRRRNVAGSQPAPKCTCETASTGLGRSGPARSLQELVALKTAEGKTPTVSVNLAGTGETRIRNNNTDKESALYALINLRRHGSDDSDSERVSPTNTNTSSPWIHSAPANALHIATESNSPVAPKKSILSLAKPCCPPGACRCDESAVGCRCPSGCRSHVSPTSSMQHSGTNSPNIFQNLNQRATLMQQPLRQTVLFRPQPYPVPVRSMPPTNRMPILPIYATPEQNFHASSHGFNGVLSGQPYPSMIQQNFVQTQPMFQQHYSMPNMYQHVPTSNALPSFPQLMAETKTIPMSTTLSPLKQSPVLNKSEPISPLSSIQNHQGIVTFNTTVSRNVTVPPSRASFSTQHSRMPSNDLSSFVPNLSSRRISKDMPQVTQVAEMKMSTITESPLSPQLSS